MSAKKVTPKTKPTECDHTMVIKWGKEKSADMVQFFIEEWICIYCTMRKEA